MALFDIIESLLRGETDDGEIPMEMATEEMNYSRKYDVDFERVEDTIDIPSEEGEGEDGEKEWGVIASDGEYYGGAHQRRIFERHRYLEDQPVYIGVNRKPSGQNWVVPIEWNDMFRHVSMFGATGYGKSTMLKNIMIQLAYKGFGFCYIDPKGDDVKDLLRVLPNERKDDVIWMQPAADEEYDRIVGFNFLSVSTEPDDPNFENEVAERVDDLKAILASRDELFARMTRVVEALATAMIKSERKFTILDLYFVLRDEDTRQEFFSSITEEGLSKYVTEANAALTQYRDEELEPLKGRIQPWILNPMTREIIAQEENSVSVEEIVDGNKILLVDNSKVRKEMKTMLATAVVRQIWGHVQKRSDVPENERTPYFLLVDEFDDVVNEQMEVSRILSKARSLKLSLTMACQNPEQLSRDLQRQIFSNTDTVLALNVGDPEQGRPIAKQFRDVDVEDYINLPQFETLTKLKVDGKNQTLKTRNFPDYPPLRSAEEAERIKLKALERYGSPRKNGEEDVELHVDGIDDPTGDEGGDNGQLVERVVDAVYIATQYQSHQRDTPVFYVKPELVEDVVEAMGYEVDNLPQMVENHANLFAQQSFQGGKDIRIGLKEKGEEMALHLDSGSSGSAGKDNHRLMLRTARDEFAKLGIAMTVPSQGGDEEEPDGIGYPFAVDPDSPASELMHDPENSTVVIEAESTTARSRPAQMLNNLRKAVDEGEKCVFLVRNGHGNESFDKEGRNIKEKVIDNPPLAVKEKDGEFKYYNKNPPHLNQKTENRDDATVLRPRLDSEGRPECRWWRREDESIVLRDGEWNVNAEFDTSTDFENWTLDDFPAYFTETVDGSYAVYLDGEFHKEYESKKELKEEWVPIREPYVPEIEFNGNLPTADDFISVILPDDSYDLDPQLYTPDGNHHSIYEYPEEGDEQVDPTPAEDETEESDESDDDDGNDPERGAIEGMMENDGKPPEFRVESDDEDDESDDDDDDDSTDTDNPFLS